MPEIPAPPEFLPFLTKIFEAGWYTNFGPLVRQLEEQLLAWVGAPQESCVTCSNATAGLSAALIATGRVGRVLLPAFTFPASLGAVRAAAMTPLVADVDPETWAFGGDRLDQALAKTGAGVVMLVAPFGMRHDLDADLSICRNRGDKLRAVAVLSGLAPDRLKPQFRCLIRL